MIQEFINWWKRIGTWKEVDSQYVYTVKRELPEGYRVAIEKRTLYRSMYDGEVKERSMHMTKKKLFKDNFEEGDTFMWGNDTVFPEDRYIYAYIA